ncbi:MAG: hypothetical protein U1E76_07965 [Planctomycetota bacterium]
MLDAREQLARTRADLAAVAADRELLAARVPVQAHVDRLMHDLDEQERRHDAEARALLELRARLEQITGHGIFKLWSWWRRLLRRPGL